MKIFFLGDIVGKSGRAAIAKNLKKIIKDGRIVLMMFLVGAFIIFWLDFQNIKSALLLACQLILGLLFLVCLMGLFQVRFTIMNVAMIPAVLAAGVDMGVHVKHPGTNVAFTGERIQAISDCIVRVYEDIFSSDPKFLLIHTHNFQGESNL